MNKANLVLALAERLYDSVDSISGKTENHLHAPIVNGVDKNVRSSCRHWCLLSRNARLVDGHAGQTVTKLVSVLSTLRLVRANAARPSARSRPCRTKR